MQKTCRQCQAIFQITNDDLVFYEKISPSIAGQKHLVPPPELCFRCRLQRRLAFYNARTLYKRICDKTDKEIISIYKPGSAMTVYDRDVWYGDSWDPFSYGREFDFNQPFFPQFRKLMEAVPVSSRAVLGMNQNSDYTNDNWKLKDCYLVFDGESSETCYHGQTFEFLRDCTDFLVLAHSELCYECTNSTHCYNLNYSRFCLNCSDSWFLRDCIGCKSCFGCANLRQKTYCIFNEQKTKSEFEAFIQALDTSSYEKMRDMKTTAEKFFLTQPVRATRGEQNIQSVGDNIHNCKNSFSCFDCAGLEDCRYMTNCLMGARDSGDIHIWGLGMELCYNCVVVGSSPQRIFCSYNVTEGVSDILYSSFCSRNSKHLFGCIGLRHKEYCILNKQYSKDEYETLAVKIIDYMRETKEWGEYFPPEISMFGYNETSAQTFFPMIDVDVQKSGWQWSDYEAPVQTRKRSTESE